MKWLILSDLLHKKKTRPVEAQNVLFDLLQKGNERSRYKWISRIIPIYKRAFPHAAVLIGEKKSGVWR